jgi:glutamine synthetase
MRTSEVAELLKKEDVKEIVLQFADISGGLHSLWVPSDLFSKVAEEGIHTDGSSVEMVDISQSDLKLIPDVDTLVLLPSSLFPQRIARVACDICEPESNRAFELDPRFVLKKVMNEAKKTLGASVRYNACSEIEFFLFKKDDNGTIRLLDDGEYLATPPRDLGDVIYLIKFLLKLTAARKGLIASFMPKPFQGQYGCGLHTHVSLTDDKKAKNLFYDAKGSHGLSKTGLHFTAGILAHAKALAAVTNPSVNSYKRLVPGWEAPVYISWARYNRSVLVRVPPGRGMRTRLEYRPTDGSCNFYTAFACILSAGLDGIKRKLDPPEPVEENIYEMSEKERVRRGIELLPESLEDALEELSRDQVIRDALGHTFYEKFLEIKTKEWRDFNHAVHEWERNRYIDV